MKIPVAVATSSEPDYAALSLKSADLGSHFKHIVTGDQIANGKPAPDIFLEAANRLKVAPETCIAFEDSEAGVLSASSAGMRVYLVPDLKVPSKATQSLAYSVGDSLNDALDHLQANCGQYSYG
jgi:beta-phosphoglucomutase-like phosphatase (HAD superfamily)